MTHSVLVVGGGITGLQTALHCVEAGANVVVVEREPVVGGRHAAALTEGNAGDASVPTLESLRALDGIEFLTNATLAEVRGGPGDFSVIVEERARFVTDTCTRCNRCRSVCPVAVSNQYDANLTYRKAIFSPLPDTLPHPFAINIDDCLNTPPNYLPCHRCVDVCDDDSIHFDMALSQQHERHVAAIVVATGCNTHVSESLVDLGYGNHSDVITSSELQRMLETPGPTGGFVSRPSDESYPDRVLLLLDYAGGFAAQVIADQCKTLRDQNVAEITVVVLAQQKSGPGLDSLQELAAAGAIQLCWATAPNVDVEPDAILRVAFEDLSSSRHTEIACDLVVLWDDASPARDSSDLAAGLEIPLDAAGFLATITENTTATARAGVYAAGCAHGPRSLLDCLSDAEHAGALAVSDLDPRQLNPHAGGQPAESNVDSIDRLDDAALRRRIESVLTKLMAMGSDRGEP